MVTPRRSSTPSWFTVLGSSISKYVAIISSVSATSLASMASSMAMSTWTSSVRTASTAGVMNSRVRSSVRSGGARRNRLSKT